MEAAVRTAMSTVSRSPGVCARCAALSGSCCTLVPGQEDLCFPLSDMEMDRIRDIAGARGWFVQEPNSASFVHHLDRLFPGEEELVRALFPPRRHHFRLATSPGGRCALLGEKGCVLPVEARPYYCRLFPVWLSGDKLFVLAGQCLAVKEATGTARLLESVNLSRPAARDLHARLRLAWGLPPRPEMPNVTLRLQRNPQ